MVGGVNTKMGPASGGGGGVAGPVERRGHQDSADLVDLVRWGWFGVITGMFGGGLFGGRGGLFWGGGVVWEGGVVCLGCSD